MWRTLWDSCEKIHLIRFSFKDGMKMQLTNLEDMWETKLSTKDFIKTFQDLNPLLDSCELSAIVKHVSSMINDSPEEEISIIYQSDGVNIELKSKIDGITIVFKILLNLLPKNAIIKEFILPLMLTVQYLESCQSQLCDLLEKKDKQIQEYEVEFGELTKRSLITEKFYRKVAFDKAPENLFLNVFHKRNFWEKISSKYGINTPTEVIPTTITSKLKKGFQIPTYVPPPKKGTGITFNSPKTSKQ